MYIYCTHLWTTVCTYIVHICGLQYAHILYTSVEYSMYIHCTHLWSIVCTYIVHICGVQYVHILYTSVEYSMYIYCTHLWSTVCTYIVHICGVVCTFADNVYNLTQFCCPYAQCPYAQCPYIFPVLQQVSLEHTYVWERCTLGEFFLFLLVTCRWWLTSLLRRSWLLTR